MRISLIIGMLVFLYVSSISAQDKPAPKYNKYELVWNGTLFKSWLMDQHVGFNKIGNQVTPVFTEQYKMGFGVNANFVHHPIEWLGIGVHLGVGLDINSVPVPLLLFGGSLLVGKENQFVINIGLADGKKRIISDDLKAQLQAQNYTDIPEIYNKTQLNTGFYIGLGMKIF